MSVTHTCEQAVEWLRQQPDRGAFVRHCYYYDPLEAAAERFYRSEEWDAVAELLGPALSGKVLDIGAGRGISSYAFARLNCLVTALEPYPSKVVGSDAIRSLARKADLPIEVVQASGEAISPASRVRPQFRENRRSLSFLSLQQSRASLFIFRGKAVNRGCRLLA